MKLYKAETTSIFDEEVREYYVIGESVEDAWNKAKIKVPCSETVFTCGTIDLHGEANRNNLYVVTIADVYEAGDDYKIYISDDTIAGAIAKIDKALSMAERLVAIEEIRKFYR